MSSNVNQWVVLRNGNSLNMRDVECGYTINIHDPEDKDGEIEVYYHTDYDNVDKMFGKIVDLLGEQN